MSDAVIKDELYFDNKKYLSSKYAGKISGYTNDYVARLCRTGRMKGRMVGRTWYVEKDSLTSFSIKNNQQKIKRSKELSNERRKEYEGVLKKPTFNIGVTKRFSIEFPFDTESLFFKKGVAVTVAIVLIVGSYTFRDFSYSDYKHTAVAVIETIKYFDLDSVANGVAATEKSIGSMFESTLERTIVTIKYFAVGAYDTLTQGFIRTDGSIVEFDKEREGIVVVLSSEQSSDSAVKQKIKESFSDEIEIIPDESGQAGIIRPVFKKSEGQDYVYVLVPINGK